jgi:predicted aspartyl protease
MMSPRELLRTTGIAVLIGLGFAVPASAQSCDHTPRASLEITYDLVSRPIVKMTIDGRDNRMIVDSGGVYSLLTWANAENRRMNMHQVDRKQLYMLNGSRAEYEVHASDVDLGGIAFHDMRFVIMPADWPLTDAEGTVSADLLAKYDIDADFGLSEMRLYDRNSCQPPFVLKPAHSVALPLQPDGDNLMRVRANVDGLDLGAVIDTGSGQTVLTLAAADAILGRPLRDDELVHVGTGTSNGWNVYRAPFHQLTIGGLIVNEPDIYVMTDKFNLVNNFSELRQDFRKPGLVPPSLIIGMSVLRKLHIYISYATNTLYVAAAGTPTIPMPAASTPVRH